MMPGFAAVPTVSPPNAIPRSARHVEMKRKLITRPRAAVSCFVIVTDQYPCPGPRILTRFPFALAAALKCRNYTECPKGLGAANSSRNTLHSKPFLTSDTMVLTLLIATTTKICTSARSSHAFARAFVASTAPAYSFALRIYTNGGVWAVDFSAIHFRGCCIRQVSFYTLLSGFQLP